MKFTKLPKEIYFPMVEGSQFANLILDNLIRPGIVIYKQIGQRWEKTMSFDKLRNFFTWTPFVKKMGYHLNTEESRRARKANRYLKRQYKRMARCMNTGNRDKYNLIWWTLATKSDAFLLAMMIRKLRFAISSYSPEKFLYLQARIRRIIRKDWTKPNFVRKFLPEYDSEGNLKKYRPLGVPSVEYRVIAGMLEFNLSNWWMRDWAPTQLACRPGLGAFDAWLIILRNIDKWPTVIGYDLAKFFDSIINYATLNTLYGELDRLGGGSYRLKASNLTIGLNDALFIMQHRRPMISLNDRDKEVNRIEKLTEELNWKRDLSRNTLTILSLLRYAAKNMSRYKSISMIGLPQGMNTSPVIACRVLQTQTDLYRRNVVVQYMDDGIKLCKTDDVEKEIQELRKSLKTGFTGIDLSGSKTEVIKHKGRWIKPLKFLGCEYDGKTFRANTRSLGRIEFTAGSGIEELIKNIKEHKSDIVFKYDRPKLAKLVSTLWNTEYTLGKPESHDRSDWSKYKYVKVDVAPNSIEMRIIHKYSGTFQPWIHSTNTISTIASGYLLGLLSGSKANVVKEAEYFTTLKRLALINRLTKEW